MIKLKMMRWAVHVAHMGEEKYRILVGIIEQKDNVENLDIDGNIILQWIQKNSDGRAQLDRYGSRQGQMAGCCELDNEPYGSIDQGSTNFAKT